MYVSPPNAGEKDKAIAQRRNVKHNKKKVGWMPFQAALWTRKKLIAKMAADFQQGWIKCASIGLSSYKEENPSLLFSVEKEKFKKNAQRRNPARWVHSADKKKL